MRIEAFLFSMPTVKSSKEPPGCALLPSPCQRLAFPTPYATMCCMCDCRCRHMRAQPREGAEHSKHKATAPHMVTEQPRSTETEGPVRSIRNDCLEIPSCNTAYTDTNKRALMQRVSWLAATCMTTRAHVMSLHSQTAFSDVCSHFGGA